MNKNANSADVKRLTRATRKARTSLTTSIKVFGSIQHMMPWQNETSIIDRLPCKYFKKKKTKCNLILPFCLTFLAHSMVFDCSKKCIENEGDDLLFYV